ncbi:hypothetical protein [Orrella marina]|uniref:Uncharacterized protein n=1 Tax=Orrella marina TaxID=2163011 RepID=A0A2R4XHF8_9BURK|nr:hypothetical protein [Orrella marina]AWB33247.1 hypothetical protein DBV39_05465 [Orrella marina]
MSSRSSTKPLTHSRFAAPLLVFGQVVALATCIATLAWTPAHSQTAGSTTGVYSSATTPSADSNAPATREEVLKTFQREAHAAYAEARKNCQSIASEQEQQICFAKAKLQFDADMRYAEKRANMGF